MRRSLVGLDHCDATRRSLQYKQTTFILYFNTVHQCTHTHLVFTGCVKVGHLKCWSLPKNVHCRRDRNAKPPKTYEQPIVSQHQYVYLEIWF